MSALPQNQFECTAERGVQAWAVEVHNSRAAAEASAMRWRRERGRNARVVERHIKAANQRIYTYVVAVFGRGEKGT